MAPEFGIVSELAGLAAVDGVIVFGKGALKELGPEAVEFCEALSNQAVTVTLLAGWTKEGERATLYVQFVIGLLLAGHLDNH